MTRHLRHGMMGAALLAGIFAAQARAEVTVSVTLTGNLDEIQAILEHIKSMGVAGGQYGESLKMNLHSVLDSESMEAEAAAPPPSLGISDPKVEPLTVKPGNEVLITVTIQDPEKVVDTVAVQDTAPGGSTFDLFDNGQEGDAAAGDGIWSRKVNVADALNPGERTLIVTAFGANGEPLAQPGAEVAAGETPPPLSIEAKYTIQP